MMEAALLGVAVAEGLGEAVWRGVLGPSPAEEAQSLPSSLASEEEDESTVQPSDTSSSVRPWVGQRSEYLLHVLGPATSRLSLAEVLRELWDAESSARCRRAAVGRLRAGLRELAARGAWPENLDWVGPVLEWGQVLWALLSTLRDSHSIQLRRACLWCLVTLCGRDYRLNQFNMALIADPNFATDLRALIEGPGGAAAVKRDRSVSYAALRLLENFAHHRKMLAVSRPAFFAAALPGLAALLRPGRLGRRAGRMRLMAVHLCRELAVGETGGRPRLVLEAGLLGRLVGIVGDAEAPLAVRKDAHATVVWLARAGRESVRALLRAGAAEVWADLCRSEEDGPLQLGVWGIRWLTKFLEQEDVPRIAAIPGLLEALVECSREHRIPGGLRPGLFRNHEARFYFRAIWAGICLFRYSTAQQQRQLVWLGFPAQVASYVHLFTFCLPLEDLLICLLVLQQTLAPDDATLSQHRQPKAASPTELFVRSAGLLGLPFFRPKMEELRQHHPWAEVRELSGRLLGLLRPSVPASAFPQAPVTLRSWSAPRHWHAHWPPASQPPVRALPPPSPPSRF